MARTVQLTRWILQRVGTAVAVSVRNPVDLARKRSEAGFVRMRFAGQCQRHHCAAMKSIFECDHCRTLRIGAGNLYRILYRFGPAINENRFLRELARSDFVHAFSQTDVTFVGSDLDTRMQEAVELVLYCIDNFLTAMPDIEASDTPGKIEITIAVDVLKPRGFGFRNIDRRAVREPAGHGFRAALG